MKHTYKLIINCTGFLLCSLLLAWIFFTPIDNSNIWGGQLILLALLLAFFGFRLFQYLRVNQLRGELLQTFNILQQFELDETALAIDKKPGSFKTIRELNTYLQELILQIQEHYHATKQFTANAAHELQTPLAIIKGHIELLIQSPRMEEKEMAAIGVILHNTNRLARLNAALILLSKIEQSRFNDQQEVQVKTIIDNILSNFQDVIQLQELKTRKQYNSSLRVNMSITLAEILIANLIQNAIRHNLEGGWIEIVIEADRLKISNPGKVLQGEPERLFKRFKRETDIEESLGLGLSIVKRICDHHKFNLEYLHKNGIHTLIVNFKS